MVSVLSHSDLSQYTDNALYLHYVNGVSIEYPMRTVQMYLQYLRIFGYVNVNIIVLQNTILY
jgi:hypothetical protein